MATIETAQDGDFDDTSTWMGGIVPVSGDTIIINHVVTLVASKNLSNSDMTINLGGLVLPKRNITLKSLIFNGGVIENNAVTGFSEINIGGGPSLFLNGGTFKSGPSGGVDLRIIGFSSSEGPTVDAVITSDVFIESNGSNSKVEFRAKIIFQPDIGTFNIRNNGILDLDTDTTINGPAFNVRIGDDGTGLYYNDVVANFTTLTIADDIILAGVYSYGDFIPSHQTYIGNNAGSITVESPPAPNIQCYALEDNAITVSWQGSSIYSYCVYRNGAIGPTTPTNSIPGADGTQMAEFTGLDPSQPYPFHIEIKLNDIVGHTTTSMMCVTTCILPGAKVLTANGAKLIEDIRSGEIVLDEFGNHVAVLHNIMFGIGEKMVVIFEANSLGDNIPDEELSITYGHEVKIPKKGGGFTENYVPVQYLVNDETITIENRGIKCTYTLMTKNKTFVMTNGVPVSTWGEIEFEECCDRYKCQNMAMLYQLL